MDIEKKALELVNQERAAEGWGPIRYVEGAAPCSIRDALHRAIEAHQADNARHAAFIVVSSRALSDVVSELSSEYTRMGSYYADKLRRFIIPQPDPLVEAWRKAWPHDPEPEVSCRQLSAALGDYELVKKEPSQ